MIAVIFVLAIVTALAVLASAAASASTADDVVRAAGRDRNSDF